MRTSKFIIVIFAYELYGETNYEYSISKNTDHTSIALPTEDKTIVFYADIHKSGDYVFGFQENLKRKVEVKYIRESNNQNFSPQVTLFNKDGTSKILDFGDLLESRFIWDNCKNGFGLVSNMAIFSLGDFVNQSLDGLDIQENIDSTLTIGNWKAGALNKFCMLVDIRNKYIIVIKSDVRGLIKISERISL
ncbi:hypothetical protein ACE5IS_10715 [Leptospira wolffii]|uniref:Uncharacterized protein n=1 Tax=Leptospira wolffii TaxID=409998 RepID=A0ABV5BTS0_9LEPT